MVKWTIILGQSKKERWTSDIELIIPIKILCFTWRAAQGRIPSATALKHRGMNIDSTHYSSCIGGVECADHIPIGCLYASYIRDKNFEWCGIKKANFNNVGDLLQFAASWGRCPKKRYPRNINIKLRSGTITPSPCHNLLKCLKQYTETVSPKA
uniref:Reverse transcriptase zinc-binding domain-containing protein n=1 Tax=Lactuca sativa TaxID=4236 RepID=A0A9R1X711_LACSA|nr:hypothetical protein LSAT_V11C500229140 [Lactuca sativa]